MSSPHDDSIAVFIASSDNTRDVFERVYPALERHWPSCAYPVYAGFNRPYTHAVGFTPIYAAASGWRDELMAQIEQLETAYVLLLLDDFLLLRRVDTVRLEELARVASRERLPYLRLIPVRRAFLPRLLHRMIPSRSAFEAVPTSDPYYSALQAVIWEREHLLECLRLEKNIWKFEELHPPGGTHYAIRNSAPISYRHVVERGRWLPDAPRLMQRAGVGTDLGSRPRWPWKYHVRRCLGLLWFEVFGYLVMRWRRRSAAGRT